MEWIVFSLVVFGGIALAGYRNSNSNLPPRNNLPPQNNGSSIEPTASQGSSQRSPLNAGEIDPNVNQNVPNGFWDYLTSELSSGSWLTVAFAVCVLAGLYMWRYGPPRHLNGEPEGDLPGGSNSPVNDLPSDSVPPESLWDVIYNYLYSQFEIFSWRTFLMPILTFALLFRLSRHVSLWWRWNNMTHPSIRIELRLRTTNLNSQLQSLQNEERALERQLGFFNNRNGSIFQQGDLSRRIDANRLRQEQLRNEVNRFQRLEVELQPVSLFQRIDVSMFRRVAELSISPGNIPFHTASYRYIQLYFFLMRVARRLI